MSPDREKRKWTVFSRVEYWSTGLPSVRCVHVNRDDPMTLIPSDEPDLSLPDDLDSLETLIDLIRTRGDEGNLIDDFGLTPGLFVGRIYP